MTYRLNTSVHAVELDDKGQQTGRSQTFGPADDLSTPENEWALAAISNPDVWDGDAPPKREAPKAQSETDRLKARIAELEAEKAASTNSDEAGKDDKGDEAKDASTPTRRTPGTAGKAAQK